MLVQKWIEKSIQAAVKITSAQPFRSGISVMLIGIPAIAGKAVTPEGWIYLRYHRLAQWHYPPVERPEVHSISGARAEIA